MALFDRKTASVLTTTLAFVALLAVIWLARLPIIAFIFAIFFAHLLEPIVTRFQGWFRVSRGKAVALTYLAIFGGLAIFGVTVGPRILEQGQRLSETLPSLFEKIRTGSIAWQFGSQQGWSTQTELRIQNWLISHQNDISEMVQNVTLRLEQIAANIPWIALVPVLAVFFLKDSSQLRHSVLELIAHSRDRGFFEGLLDDLDTMLATYVRAQLLLCLFAAVAYVTFLLIMRFPYAMAVGAIGGVLEFIPFVGPLLTLGMLVAIAFLSGYSHWIVIVGFWVVWRGVQDYVNAPRVMGKGLDLHPLAVIFAVLVGGEVGGVIGIFLSIPTVAALRILWLNWNRRAPTRKAA
jgi:predicted PurR-regulated permease PerM